MGNTGCDYNRLGSGRQVFWDKSTEETLSASYPLYFYDDFIGADLVIPEMGSAESGCKWAYKDVSAVGAPTLAKTADGVNGSITATLHSQAEEQAIQLNMDDQLVFSIAQGLIFEARLTCSTLPTGAAARCIFGVGGEWKQGGADYRTGFEILTDGTINAESDDNVNDESEDTGVTAVAGDYNIFRIDCTIQSDIKFYIDGKRVAEGTTFNNVSTGGNEKMQVTAGLVKTADAAVGTMILDYIKVWQNRA